MADVPTRLPSGKQEMLVVAACALVIVAVLITLKMQQQVGRDLQEFETRLNLSDGRNGYSRSAAGRVPPSPAPDRPSPAGTSTPAPVPHPETEGDPTTVHIPHVVEPPPGAVVQRPEQ